MTSKAEIQPEDGWALEHRADSGHATVRHCNKANPDHPDIHLRGEAWLM